MRTFNYIVSLAIAAGAGIAIGILTAPRSGKRTRARIINELDDAKKALEESTAEQLKKTRKAIKKNVKAQINNGKEAVTHLKESVHL